MAKKKTVEDQFQKLEQREQILLRPDSTIGSVVSDDRNMFVVNMEEDSIKIKNKTISYNPGFFKIFDEVLTNASDHYLRTGLVKYIKINVEKDNISVENDGPGVPVQMHKIHKVHVPELVFGHLNSSENYDDTIERTWGGRNGIGAKATNMFSKKFIIETADGTKKYVQTFTNNMSVKTKPIITASKKSYTKIHFYPDFERFGMNEISDDKLSLIIRRCLDVSLYCSGVKVYFNDKLLPVKSFRDYMKFYDIDENNIFYEKMDDNWEIGLSASLDNNFNQISMVNGISTYNGGTHVNFIINQIVKEVLDILSKKYKKITIKPNDIKNRLFLFVNAKIVNPSFNEQSKETLNTKLTVNLPKISEKLIKSIANSDIIKDLIDFLTIKDSADAKKEIGKHKIKISKLDDAKKAGTVESEKCMLFLAEGDCLQENTEMYVIRNGDKIKVEMKDIKIGDAVITHNNNIGIINSISRKIKKIVKIKLKNDEILLCSEEHKWYVYDKDTSKFFFIKTKDIDISKHRMIINKNIFYDDFIKIKDIFEYDGGKYNKMIVLNNGVEILSTDEHKFSVFNTNDYRFDMICCSELNKDIHFIVSYEKI